MSLPEKEGFELSTSSAKSADDYAVPPLQNCNKGRSDSGFAVFSMGKEISLVGFDNRQFARACNPRLTIVAQPTDRIAADAAGMMLEALSGKDGQPRTAERLRAEILPGQSVRDLRGSL